jgi:hypothetical protein
MPQTHTQTALVETNSGSKLWMTIPDLDGVLLLRKRTKWWILLEKSLNKSWLGVIVWNFYAWTMLVRTQSRYTISVKKNVTG